MLTPHHLIISHTHFSFQIGIVHTVLVKDIFVHMDPPYPQTYQLEHPLGEEGEYLTKYGVGKLYTAKGIRGGCDQE